MKFLILSRRAALTVVPSLEISHAVISITDPDNRKPAQFTISDFTKDVLYIKCYDVDKGSANYFWYPERYKKGAFTKEQAVEILDFMEEVKDDIDTLVVHCDAGISRSSGVAAALSLIYTGTDKGIFMDKRYTPNMFMYRTILNIHNKIL